MFQYENTAIFNSEFNIPEPDESREQELTGSCSATSAIGIPENFQELKTIFCKVNINASLDGRDTPLFSVVSISKFTVINDESSEEIIIDKATKECSKIAIQETLKRIADVTELLCGKRIDIPVV